MFFASLLRLALSVTDANYMHVSGIQEQLGSLENYLRVKRKVKSEDICEELEDPQAKRREPARGDGKERNRVIDLTEVD